MPIVNAVPDFQVLKPVIDYRGFIRDEIGDFKPHEERGDEAEKARYEEIVSDASQRDRQGLPAQESGASRLDLILPSREFMEEAGVDVSKEQAGEIYK